MSRRDSDIGDERVADGVVGKAKLTLDPRKEGMIIADISPDAVRTAVGW